MRPGTRPLMRERLLSALLLVMVFVITGLLAIILLAAFWDLEQASEKVQVLYEQSLDDVEGMNRSQESKASVKSNIRSLKALAKEVLQTHTIAFLFQVFSVALLTGGAYLVARCETDVGESASRVRRIKVQVAHLGGFISNASVSVALVGHALVAVERVCVLVKASKHEELTTQLAVARDLLRELRDHLAEASDKRIGIDKSQYVILLDEIRNILQMLKTVPADGRGRVSDLAALGEDCDRILKSSDFLGRYERLSSEIGRGRTEDAVWC